MGEDKFRPPSEIRGVVADEKLRMWCIEHALQHQRGHPSATVMDLAKEMYEFVKEGAK